MIQDQRKNQVKSLQNFRICRFWRLSSNPLGRSQMWRGADFHRIRSPSGAIALKKAARVPPVMHSRSVEFLPVRGVVWVEISMFFHVFFGRSNLHLFRWTIKKCPQGTVGILYSEFGQCLRIVCLSPIKQRCLLMMNRKVGMFLRCLNVGMPQKLL